LEATICWHLPARERHFYCWGRPVPDKVEYSLPIWICDASLCIATYTPDGRQQLLNKQLFDQPLLGNISVNNATEERRFCSVRVTQQWRSVFCAVCDEKLNVGSVIGEIR
jgi:hypothetical protein